MRDGPTTSSNGERVDHAGRTSPVLVALAWLFVGVPLAWGVEQTAAKSLALFMSSTPSAATTVPTPSPAR